MPENNNNVQIKTFNSILDEDARVNKVITGIAWMGALIALLIGTKAWLAAHFSHSIILFLFSIFMMLTAIALKWHDNTASFRLVFLLLAGSMLVYLISTGGESNTGILWFYVFPPFLFYVAGLRNGCWMMLIMACVIFVILRYPELPWVHATYTNDFQLRFAASVTFVTVLSFAMDYSRRSAREELLTMGKLYEHAARTDELTKLPNRRDMKQALEKEYYRYKRHGSYFSVILLDIDFFKAVNDGYGHDAGDYVLRQFSALIVATCRKIDTAARWGGEEFIVLLPDTSLVQALAMAERLRKNTENHKMIYKNRKIKITTSCGVCSISQTKDLSALLKQADVNLYQAKVKGRNRVIPLVKQTT